MKLAGEAKCSVVVAGAREHDLPWRYGHGGADHVVEVRSSGDEIAAQCSSETER
jgi:hypothetical protein